MDTAEIDCMVRCDRVGDEMKSLLISIKILIANWNSLIKLETSYALHRLKIHNLTSNGQYIAGICSKIVR